MRRLGEGAARGRIARVGARSSGLSERFWFGVCIVAAASLLLLTRLENQPLQQVKSALWEALTPVLEVVSAPVQALRDMKATMVALHTARDENIRLKAENDGLRRWQTVALALTHENARLRQLAGYKPAQNTSYVTAQAVASMQHAHGHYVVVNAGRMEGVRRYQPVTDAYGLVGRVTDVSGHSARVLLITDVNARVPVVTATSRERAILTGTGGEILALSFTTPRHRIKVGEAVMTTDDGGLVPGNILVGTVFSVDGRNVLVKPVRPVADAEYVQVVQSRNVPVP
jgi:rod shape-determining protein MreC